MSKPYRKQHIYAFVINKKISTAFTALIATVFTVVSAFGIVSDSRNLYTEIYFMCHSRFYYFANLQKGIAEALKPDVSTIMKTASPLLYDTTAGKKVESDYAPVKSEATQSITATGYDTVEKNVNSENLSFKNETSYSVNLKNLSESEITYTATGDSPRVLILHTHACESYSLDNGAPAGDNGTYRSVSDSKNVVSLGERICQKLQDAGINAIHDTTHCDYPAYNEAYKNSLEVATRYLEKYPSINFIFDIHRDAISDTNNTPVKLTCDIAGIKTAQIMTVCGTDAMGLPHPKWNENLTLASKIQKYLETKYPGVARPLNIRRERFNMHTTPGSLIFEIGTHANTLNEATRGADILSEAIISVLTNQS